MARKTTPKPAEPGADPQTGETGPEAFVPDRPGVVLVDQRHADREAELARQRSVVDAVAAIEWPAANPAVIAQQPGEDA